MAKYGKAASKAVETEMEHKKTGKHKIKSRKQAIAIGLSKARRAGVDLPPPEKGSTSEETRRNAESAYKAGHTGHHKVSRTRSRATRPR